MRHIFIGDVHGMDKALEELLEQVAPTTEDQIIFVGDLVDKGPNSAGVVRRARELSQTQNVVLVLGNHEDTHARYRKHLVNLPKTAEEMAKNKPHLPVITAELTDADVAFLDTAILFHRVPEHNILVVHGGISGSMRTFPETVEQVNTLSGRQRKRFKTILRTRFIDADSGHMKSLGDEAPTDPYWAEVYDGRFGHVVFGHEAFDDGVQTFPHATGIDTGAVYGNGLTAMIVESDGSRSYITVPTTKEAEPMIRG